MDRNMSVTTVSDESLVDVSDLIVTFRLGGGLLARQRTVLSAVDGVSLAICRGETLGLVGESGCGKTTLGRAVLCLPRPTRGTVRFDGRDLTVLGSREIRQMRRHMQMIFQDPYSCLDPKMTVRQIVGEPIRTHRLASGRRKDELISELLEVVGFNPLWLDRYPHEFSGGQRQRIGIARALALRPQFIVCDEPTSALDVSIRAQVLNLLVELRRTFGLTYLFISHDLGVIRHMSDRVGVMYLGKVVELGPVDSIFSAPAHPYTHGLLSALPVPDPDVERVRKRIVLSGDVPNPASPPAGCRFHTRCWLYERLNKPENCHTMAPELRQINGQHRVACHFAEEAMKSPSGVLPFTRRPSRRMMAAPESPDIPPVRA
jgi:oligopeptide/dipeptide ABC transporter ATP-binding protein